VGLLVIGALLFIIYLLGEQAGREGPSRSKQLQEIVSKKAELKNMQSQLGSSTTSPIAHIIVVVAIIFLLLKIFGLWNDDDDYYRRRH
jgi:type IV secretory pathway VirB2 component (pilin)